MRLQKSDSESGVDSRPFHFFSFDSDSALGLEELNPTPIPGGKWWSGVDSDSESRQNGVDSGFGVDFTGINYKSAASSLIVKHNLFRILASLTYTNINVYEINKIPVGRSVGVG